LNNSEQERLEEELAEEEGVDELEQARAEAAGYLDQLQRTQAEFANYKKRIEREREEFISLANAALISKFLPILDDCKRALETVPDKLRGLTWVEGIALIERRLQMTLEQEGLSEIEAVGNTFDPEWHHAVVSEETTEYPDGEIIGELQKGYKLNDRLLRPSMVRVAAKPARKNREDSE